MRFQMSDDIQWARDSRRNRNSVAHTRNRMRATDPHILFYGLFIETVCFISHFRTDRGERNRIQQIAAIYAEPVRSASFLFARQ